MNISLPAMASSDSEQMYTQDVRLCSWGAAISVTNNLPSVDKRSCSCEAIPQYECAKSLG